MTFRLIIFFFFFKQKTAYEMRISDWSSDVCSSDLQAARPSCHARRQGAARGDEGGAPASRLHRLPARSPPLARRRDDDARRSCRRRADLGRRLSRRNRLEGARGDRGLVSRVQRSEEHTSELQSLMRLSYAVICLKKKIRQ